MRIPSNHCPRTLGRYKRFKTASGDATDVRVLDDWRVLFNLTIWRSLDDLRHYVYHTEHAAFLSRRREWFVPPPKEAVAMWWIAQGHYPSVDEALSRLERLWEHGPSAEAFTMKQADGPDGRPLKSVRRGTGASPTAPSVFSMRLTVTSATRRSAVRLARLN